ncbi:MAG: DUF1311 domain-containing protein [Alkalinema sp. CAN_BIN05]|nr:DUF1311 domain-containing protein [Alkalinema sp. CAN_BIN05]
MNYLIPALTMTLVVTALALPGHSEKDPLTNINCKAAMTQRDMNYCADLSFKAADQKLNQIYRQLRNTFKQTKQNTQEPKLIDAQLAWLKYRDLDCKFRADRFKGGSIAPLIYSSCQETLTKQRTTLLIGYLEARQL